MSDAGAEYEFIQLDRTFHELSKYASESDDADIGQAFHVGKRLSWSDIANEYRTVILSEAGTGKTEEIRHVAETLRAEGKQAFFIRLEHIPDDFEDAFEVGAFEEFQNWLASSDEGWLLLDSVDEARLRSPGDFELAVLKLGKRIAAAKQRTHIVITGRTTAWRPKTDLEHCARHLAYTPPIVEAKDQAKSDDGPDLDFETPKETKATKPKGSPFKIIALDDLSPDQIRRFAAARNVKDTQAFLDAVERADAWTFTARPQDLEELAGFWNDNARIGSRLEIMRNSIDRRLTERKPDTADARPMALDRARKGARSIAAATTLAHEATIRIPGASNSQGIPIREVLTDWDEKDCATLLDRPIFDEAIYGGVRFHHRSVREYLTAEWLADLLKCETSRRKIEELLFRTQYGIEVVVPTMRPVLPWLAILDDKVRERLGHIAPELLLEGGDPSQLPLDTRRGILHKVCEQLASGATSRTMTDFAAVQRFASNDLAADVVELLGKYGANDDLAWFLLRMVWLGELKQALPSAKAFALSPTAGKYTRIAAFRAVRAVGSQSDLQEVRSSFATEAASLNRDWLAELLDSLTPTVETVTWLFECLERVEDRNPHSVDQLTDAVDEFVKRAEPQLVPPLIDGLNTLLERPPVRERRYCEISTRYSWLIGAAAHGVERLIETRHTAALNESSLAVLQKVPIAKTRDIDDYRELKGEFGKLVPAWPELNRASFWHDVSHARAALDVKKAERLNDFWQVSIYGAFWHFHDSDFDYFVDQMTTKELADDRLISLSLAFRLYVLNGRDRVRRERLKKAAAADPELASALTLSLKPPAKGRSSWRRSEARWKRRSEARERKQKKNRADWQTALRGNPDKIRDSGLKPGLLSNWQYHLLHEARDKDGRSGRWTDGNWKALVEEFGDEVAHAYREGAIQFWQSYAPQLRSEGASANSTPYAVIFGLVGLQIDARETPQWENNLTPARVDQACRFASYELNGFPSWFARLFAKHTTQIRDFLLAEMRYELSNERRDQDSHYIISDIIYDGEWAWESLSPSVFQMLRGKEPKNLSNLNHLLQIVQASSLPDADLAKLASRKAKALRRPGHAAAWFAVWAGVDPAPAIAALEDRLKKIEADVDRIDFAMKFITQLLGGRRSQGSKVRAAYRSAQHLKALYLLMHEHIRSKEDIERAGKGVYSPGLRDDAQDARNSLSETLRSMPGKEAYIALREIAQAHPEESYRPWFALHAKAKAQLDADLTPWTAAQVREFSDAHERTPNNHRDLADLGRLRLLDLKDDIENGDSSLAKLLLHTQDESEMRTFIGRELRKEARGRYSVPQEEEFADAKRSDLRFHGANVDAPVPLELKLADNWTGPEIFERLENQLCGDYLRDNRSRRGLFVLVNLGSKKNWQLPDSAQKVDFDGLIAALENHWETRAPSYPGVDHVDIIGVDVPKRLR